MKILSEILVIELKIAKIKILGGLKLPKPPSPAYAPGLMRWFDFSPEGKGIPPSKGGTGYGNWEL